MKLLGILLTLGVEPIAHLTGAQVAGGDGQPSALRAGASRFADRDVPNVGISAVRAIAPGDEQVAKDLMEEFGSDGRTTVARVELGELLCESLTDVSDSAFLRFAISSDETVIAELTSYSSLDGSEMPDGNEHKIWLGSVVDPEPVYRRTVAMTWADPCEVESFILTINSEDTDGSVTTIESIPCEAGSGVEFCMVEFSEAVNEEEDIKPIPMDDQGGGRNLQEMKGSIHARGLRSLQEDPEEDWAIGPTVVVDVLVLYTREAWSNYDMTEEQLGDKIISAYVSVNDAMVNSKINLEINLRHVQQSPAYLQGESSISASGWLTRIKRNLQVVELRNLYRADLVQLFGHFSICGRGNVFSGGQDHQAFSVVSTQCIDQFSPAHELGHNFGAGHDRTHTKDVDETEYSHGMRYCKLLKRPYHTIMAYTSPFCFGPRVNFFSNPDVEFKEKPTGTNTTDNARTIKENMFTVSHFRDDCLGHAGHCTSNIQCCGGAGCVRNTCGGGY